MAKLTFALLGSAASTLAGLQFPSILISRFFTSESLGEVKQNGRRWKGRLCVSTFLLRRVLFPYFELHLSFLSPKFNSRCLDMLNVVNSCGKPVVTRGVAVQSMQTAD